MVLGIFQVLNNQVNDTGDCIISTLPLSESKYVCDSTDTWMTGNQSGVSYNAKVGHEENICQGDKESLGFKFSQTSIK